MKLDHWYNIFSLREPIGVIILEGCTVELAEEETEVFAFKVKPKVRVLIFFYMICSKIFWHKWYLSWKKYLG